MLRRNVYQLQLVNGVTSLLAVFLCVFTVHCAVDRAVQHERRRLSRQWDFGSVHFNADFPSARLSGCSEKAGKYILSISPETVPINHSPWYCFAVTADTKRDIQVVLKYTYSRHRYWPKLSRDAENWTKLEQSRMVHKKEGQEVELHLTVDDQPTWISAQPIFSNEHYRQLNKEYLKNRFLESRILGYSLEGRPIVKLETCDWKGEKPGNVVLIGRQHPPETTGALGMVTFIRTLLKDTDLARAFRSKFRLIIVPNLNPDGVAHGHWRTNMNGVDLNRDWGPFTQPETRLMQRELSRFKENRDGQLYLGLDFHSTRYNLIYTQGFDIHTVPEAFAFKWYDAIMERLPEADFYHEPVHSPGKPIFKSYVYREFGAPGVTYEMGDCSTVEEIDLIATVAAEEMMRLLIAEFNQTRK
ncbi:MAG: hypothetical protein CR997_06110 [Acidobacteria bacterium]|nr:MAG: hypothetical protein CR997_06110 [Acidobacteriota bacterium]